MKRAITTALFTASFAKPFQKFKIILMKHVIFLFLIVLFSLSACDDYLDRKNLDTFDESNFWTSEDNMRLFVQGIYTAYFTGYGSGYSWGNYFTGGAWSDEYSSSSIWTQNTATSGNGWSFTYVRRANLIVSRTDLLPESDETKNHWRGVGRFFRAMEYADLARAFGDVPWYDPEVQVTDTELAYKQRDALELVATNIMEDFQYAADHVRTDDGDQQVNRDVVLAFMSRHLLYFGTFMKYHDLNTEVATNLLEGALWAAGQLIDGGNYEVYDDYRGLFTSEDLTGNSEMILFRQYEEAKASHCLVSYNNQEAQTGITLKMVETYLSADGLPVKQSPLYDYSSDNGLRFYPDQFKNRDPRMAATLVDSVRISGAHTGYSTTGFPTLKFLPVDANSTDLKYLGSTNTTDAPVIRYGEVLLNYAEAAAELGQFTQEVADKTINQLRARNIPGTDYQLPAMVVSGDQVLANGGAIDDPDRDTSVSPLLWEIRRERCVELMFEGFRKNDLRRWKKYEYLKTVETDGPTTMGKGAYVDLSVFDAATLAKVEKAVHFYYPEAGNTSRAFIYNLYDTNMRRDWVTGDSYYERQYLKAVPLDQIKLYSDLGYELFQNPGWDTE